MAMQAMFPIYLPKTRKEEQSAQDYDISVSQNECNLNQNIENLYQRLEALTALSESQAVQLASQTIIIQKLQEAINNG